MPTPPVTKSEPFQWPSPHSSATYHRYFLATVAVASPVREARNGLRLAAVSSPEAGVHPQASTIDTSFLRVGVSIGDIFSALQTTMGGTYVNDFNRFGRTWQVKVQADASDRKGVEDIFRVRVRTAQGDLAVTFEQDIEGGGTAVTEMVIEGGKARTPKQYKR